MKLMKTHHHFGAKFSYVLSHVGFFCLPWKLKEALRKQLEKTWSPVVDISQEPWINALSDGWSPNPINHFLSLSGFPLDFCMAGCHPSLFKGSGIVFHCHILIRCLSWYRILRGIDLPCAFSSLGGWSLSLCVHLSCCVSETLTALLGTCPAPCETGSKVETATLFFNHNVLTFTLG